MEADAVVDSQNNNQSDFLHNSTNNTGFFEPCQNFTVELSNFRFFFVGVFGTTVSLGSILENSLLMYTFLTRKAFSTSHMYYLSWLAATDVLICLSYILLMAFYNVFAPYAQSLFLYRMVHLYARPMFAISIISMTASSFLMVAAATERCFGMLERTRQIWDVMCTQRRLIAICAVMTGVLSRGTVFFEINVIYRPECAGTFGEYEMGLNELITHHWYAIYRFYIRNILTVVLPFAILSLLNAVIVIQIRKKTLLKRKKTQFLLSVHRKSLSMAQQILASKHQEQIRRRRSVELQCATRLLVLVVLSNLIARSLDVVITIWEYVDAESLINLEEFYTISVDMISLLTVISTAFRLPIYCFCDSNLRHELYVILHDIMCCVWPPRKSSYAVLAPLFQTTNLLLNTARKNVPSSRKQSKSSLIVEANGCPRNSKPSVKIIDNTNKFAHFVTHSNSNSDIIFV